jgi:hypothetical protein
MLTLQKELSPLLEDSDTPLEINLPYHLVSAVKLWRHLKMSQPNGPNTLLIKSKNHNGVPEEVEVSIP